jgi:hypothetical protein
LYEVLFQYLQSEKPLSLPGVGVLQLQRVSAQVDIAGKVVVPPSFNFVLLNDTGDIQLLFNWIKEVYKSDADKLIADTSGLLKGIQQKVDAGDSFVWKGVGKIYKQTGKIYFDSEKFDKVSAESVSAHKIIREFAEHKVRVGEEEKTSTEMAELLNKPVKKLSYELVVAAILLGFSLSFLGWYYYENAYSLTCFSSQTKSQVLGNGSTYKNVQ